MNTCPECGSCLNATVTIPLYDVQLKQGEIVSYDGGLEVHSSLLNIVLHDSDSPTIEQK